MDDISLGRVVWMNVTDPQDKPAGEHAVIVITTQDEHLAGKPLKGVVVSTKLHLAAKDRRVEVPWQRGGHPRTGFSERCAAMCDWTVLIDEDHINTYGGYIPMKYLTEIIKKTTQS